MTQLKGKRTSASFESVASVKKTDTRMLDIQVLLYVPVVPTHAPPPVSTSFPFGFLSA